LLSRIALEDNQAIATGQFQRRSLRVNLPNSITLIRICMIPLLMWVLSTNRLSSVNGEKEILASALFIAASLTDGIDGYIARRRGQITTIGILLDPLADKLLIAAAFITLVQFNPRLVPAWIAVVIIGREFLVSGLRAIAASEGFTIEASDLGKFKMFVQIVSVVAVILDHRWLEWHFGRYILSVHWVALLAIWFMVALSLISAADYFAAFWRRIDRHAWDLRMGQRVLPRVLSKGTGAIPRGRHVGSGRTRSRDDRHELEDAAGDARGSLQEGEARDPEPRHAAPPD
jgi:CDP-diacylglycerol--glycerol-3-phosphate 3-phosphatidyltransferase